jgi:hypothetical protein
MGPFDLGGPKGILGLSADYGGLGLAPYGLRHSGLAAKGKGFFGPVPSNGGVSTEISSEAMLNGKPVEFPLMVPSLSAPQLLGLLQGQQPPDDVYKKAIEHALMRMNLGLSPFAQPNEFRYPLPKY